MGLLCTEFTKIFLTRSSVFNFNQLVHLSKAYLVYQRWQVQRDQEPQHLYVERICLKISVLDTN